MYLDSHQYEEVKEIIRTFYRARHTVTKEELARRQSIFVKIVIAHVFVGLIVFWKFAEFPRWGYLFFWASCWTLVSLVYRNKNGEESDTSRQHDVLKYIEEIRDLTVTCMERELFFCLLEAVQEKESDIDEHVKEALRLPNLRSLQFVQDLEATYCKKVLV
jgi:hypothetical protein